MLKTIILRIAPYTLRYSFYHTCSYFRETKESANGLETRNFNVGYLCLSVADWVTAGESGKLSAHEFTQL